MPETVGQGKYASLHYRLTNEEWTEIIKILNLSELKVLYYLRTLAPFGDRFQDARTKNIAAEVGISQRSVQRAVLKLQGLGLIDLEITEFKFKFKSRHEDRQATPMSPPRHTDRDRDTHVATATPMSPLRHPCRDRAPEPSLDKGSRSPHTLKTLKTNQTLSNAPTESSEREGKISPEFKEWLSRKAAQLPTPPTLREQWIQKQAQVEANQEEFRKWREGQRLEKTADFLQMEKIEVEPETLEQRLERYQRQWNTPVLQKGIKDAIASHPEWNMEISPEGPQWGENNSQAPSPVMVATDCQIAKLGLSEEALEEYLHQWFAKETRSQLTDDQHYDLLQRLQRLEAAV